MVTANDIKLGLKSAFAPPGWRVFFEVGNDTGARVKRHADAVAIGIWPSNGHLIHGFEIKVSRGDFLNEMKDPSKSQAVFQFCDRWSLITPPGLVKASELPEPWGLMTFNGKSTRTVKKAPPLQPVPLTGGFVAAMLRRAGEADDRMLQAMYNKGVEETQRSLHERMEREKKRVSETVSYRQSRAEEALREYKEVFGDMPIYEIRRLAPALRAIQQFGVPATANTLRRTLQQLDGARGAIQPLLDHLEEEHLFGDLL